LVLFKIKSPSLSLEFYGTSPFLYFRGPKFGQRHNRKTRSTKQAHSANVPHGQSRTNRTFKFDQVL
ncbi:MAG: hypothetical protein ACREBR_03395, partial [bacterium]